MNITLFILLLLAPIIFIILRFLSIIITYYVHRAQILKWNPDIPRVKDPMHILKGWALPDSIEVLMKEMNEMGNGQIPPVVFMGPYLNHGRPSIYITDIEILKEMGDDREFPKLKTLYECLAYFLGDGIAVIPHGAKWKSHRTAMNPFFYPNKIKFFSEKMTSVGSDMVKELREINGKEIDVVQFLGSMTQRVLIESMFSSKIDSAKVANLWSRVFEYFGHFFLGDVVLGRLLNQYSPMSWRIISVRKQFKQLILPLIQMARDDPNPPEDDRKDFIETLVSLKNEKGLPLMTDNDICEEAQVMLFAGHDTTKNSLSWTIYFLSKHPEEVQKIRKEVETELKGHAPTYADIPNLRCCKNAFMEALRLRAPVPQVARYTVRERTLAGVRIPQGATVAMNLQGVMMDGRHWKEPFEFRPDRFNEEELYNKIFLPFSMGYRDCIGRRFALSEGILFVALLVQNFDFERSDKDVIAVFEGSLMPKNFFCKFIPIK